MTTSDASRQSQRAQPSIPIACIVLAAGASSRMKAAVGEHKLRQYLTPEETLLASALRLYESLPFEEILLVASEETKDAQFGKGARARRSRIIVNPNAADGGMASSIALGAATAHAEAQGFLIALGDMPFLRRETLIRLCESALQSGADAIAAPLFNGKRGHPVVFGAAHKEDLARLTGAKGAQSIIRERRESLVLIDTDDAGVVADIDAPEDWEQARATFPAFFQPNSSPFSP